MKARTSFQFVENYFVGVKKIGKKLVLLTNLLSTLKIPLLSAT